MQLCWSDQAVTIMAEMVEPKGGGGTKPQCRWWASGRGRWDTVIISEWSVTSKTKKYSMHARHWRTVLPRESSIGGACVS